MKNFIIEIHYQGQKRGCIPYRIPAIDSAWAIWIAKGIFNLKDVEVKATEVKTQR